jgi:hypothetical protein
MPVNPYLILGGVLLSIATFFYGSHVGRDEEKAGQLAVVQAEQKTQAAIEAVKQSAQAAAAAEIAKITVNNQTIVQPLQKEIQTNTVYQTCQNTDIALDLINQAIAGAIEQKATP